MANIDRRLTAKTLFALAGMNIRLWTSVAPIVHRELAKWKQQAESIADPELREIALTKLTEERFNAQVAATLATLAPRRLRDSATEAIVAYEVMYDYLDGVTERPGPDPIREGKQLYQPLIAIGPAETPLNDSGYLQQLARVVQTRLLALPAAGAVAESAGRAALRCAEAQLRTHAAPTAGHEQLTCWARTGAAAHTMDWRMYLAGSASSVLNVHALIAAAADHRTNEKEAEALDLMYLQIGTLCTMLDSLIDHDHDTKHGQTGFDQLYDSKAVLGDALAHSINEAITISRELRNPAYHVMTVAGVVAYYTTAPSASSPYARPVATRVQRELQPLTCATLAMLRLWRTAKGRPTS